MKRGKTEAETLKLNGWGIGDILEGEECGKLQRIRITTVGEELFLCRWDYRCDGNFGPEHGSTTLCAREWEKVGEK